MSSRVLQLRCSRILDLASHPRVRDVLVEHDSVQYLLLNVTLCEQDIVTSQFQWSLSTNPNTFIQAMWINAVVKLFSRPALQSESSPPWIFSTFAKRFTSISCRKQTRYFSACSGDPLLANMFGPYSYITRCFLKTVALQGTHPSRPKNSRIGGLVARSKLHPGQEEPHNLEWNVYIYIYLYTYIYIYIYIHVCVCV